MISIPRHFSITAQSGPGVTLQFTAATGDCFAILIAWQGVQTITAVTDSQKNSYILARAVSVGSGSTQLNGAIYYCISAKGSKQISTATVSFSASTTILAMGMVDLNGATQPILIDPTGTASATFSGGSDTTTPNVAISLTYPGEESLAIVVCPGGNTMSSRTGWTNLLTNNLNYGFFSQSLTNNSGSFTVEPCTLSASVSSLIVTTAFAAPQFVSSGAISSPRLPDTFSPRYADDPYDSLSGDPTYTANTNGPQPYL